ncbi:MAG: hypothetical protein NTU83_14410, partial [Candidatus Hydrogenedentes bacterium]|nr:hypothetical protein [Candidatus Hydrogenedentota bacterium]
EGEGWQGIRQFGGRLRFSADDDIVARRSSLPDIALFLANFGRSFALGLGNPTYSIYTNHIHAPRTIHSFALLLAFTPTYR